VNAFYVGYFSKKFGV